LTSCCFTGGSIAATANLATGTIYRYFPSKADLLAEELSIVSQREVDVIEGIASTAGSAKQRLADTVGAFVARAFRGRRLAYALIAEPCDPEIDQARLAAAEHAVLHREAVRSPTSDFYHAG
jgi:AcrR family transcriptional regulator